jgi:hypothetical protein
MIEAELKSKIDEWLRIDQVKCSSLCLKVKLFNQLLNNYKKRMTTLVLKFKN